MSQCWFSYIIIDPLIILLCTLVVRFLVRFFNCMVTDDDHMTNIRYGFVAQFGRYDVIGDSDVLLRVSIKISKGKKNQECTLCIKELYSDKTLVTGYHLILQIYWCRRRVFFTRFQCKDTSVHVHYMDFYGFTYIAGTY